mgnify:CR=1 FL=1
MLNFLDRFPSEPETSMSLSLEVLKLREEPRIIAMFSAECEEVSDHYIETSEHRGYVKCNSVAEGRCLLCDLQQQSESRVILSVYDVETESVKALLVSDARSPYSLGPQLRRELERGELDKRFLLLSRSFNKFEVRSIAMPEDVEINQVVIADFLNQIKQGNLSLDGVIPHLPNRELVDIPELSRKAMALGLHLVDYQKAATGEIAADE